MRARDLLRFALSALWQHKVRSLLTLGGVVAGAFLLVVSIAVGQGVEETTVQQFRKYGRLRSVSVFPGFQPLPETGCLQRAPLPFGKIRVQLLPI